jgi:hypothetical protein
MLLQARRRRPPSCPSARAASACGSLPPTTTRRRFCAARTVASARRSCTSRSSRRASAPRATATALARVSGAQGGAASPAVELLLCYCSPTAPLLLHSCSSTAAYLLRCYCSTTTAPLLLLHYCSTTAAGRYCCSEGGVKSLRRGEPRTITCTAMPRSKPLVSLLVRTTNRPFCGDNSVSPPCAVLAGMAAHR